MRHDQRGGGGEGERGGSTAKYRKPKYQGKEGAGQGGGRRELRGRVVVKMKAPPFVAAPLVRGRRNRPIDSRYIPRRRHDSTRPTTTFATAGDS
ncbi:hypothetical protein K0M31_004405 [Melipona bicolor]|uniref:Uncharacterized protein n=1 Tax=Melipona bicolor TaxID=60889 RepID=A0AA40FWP4_9HYME|nr:hypothetical protein K0M31_004405 [Melipona bicolor]